MSRYVYHGRNRTDGRFGQALGYRIPGSQYTIYDVDEPETIDRDAIPPIGIEGSPYEYQSQRQVSITGGLTDSVKAARKFHYSMSHVGLVFIIDRGKLNIPLTTVEYNFEWLEQHPGVWARIDSIQEFEVYSGGKLVHSGYYNNAGDPVLDKARGDIKYSANNFAYENEAEIIAFTDQIDFWNALEATGTYVHEKKAIGGAIQTVLSEFDGYTTGGFSTRGEDNVLNMSREEQARALYEEMVVEMGKVPENYHIVVTEDDRAYRGDPGPIDADKFVLAYNGSEIIRSASRIPHILGHGGVNGGSL